MPLIKCLECSKEISDTAKSCPNCGKRLKKSSTGKIIGIITIAVVFVIVVIFLMSARNAAQTSNTAHEQLNSALGYYPSELISQAKELSNKFLISESEIIQAEVILAGYTKNEEHIKKLIPSVVNVAVAKKISLTRAADEVGQLLVKP